MHHGINNNMNNHRNAYTNNNIYSTTNGVPFNQNFVPPNGNGGNPNGNFNPQSTNSMFNKNFSQNNFNNNYKPSEQVIEKYNFRNNNDLVHNNVAENVMSEHIAEYQINIDSNDRAINTYPNPFRFSITFEGIGRSVDKNNEIIEGSPSPVINRSFKNVKFIKIDYLILPRTIMLNKKDNKYNLSLDEKYELSPVFGPNNLTINGYLIIRIKELGSNRILSTNNVIGNNSFVIYPDKLLGRDFVLWVPANGSRIFTNALLGNLKKLTIEILDPNGNQIAVTDSDFKEVDFRKTINPVDELTKSLKLLIPNLKCYLSVLLGVVENEINTNTKYEF